MKSLNKLIEVIKIFWTFVLGFLIVNFFYYPQVFAFGEDNNSGGSDPDGISGWIGIILSVGVYLFFISLDLVRTCELKSKENNTLNRIEHDQKIENVIIEKFDLNFLKYKILNLKTSYFNEEPNIILNFLWAHWDNIMHSIALLGGGLIYHSYQKSYENKNKRNKKEKTKEEEMDVNKQQRDFAYTKKLEDFKEEIDINKKLELNAEKRRQKKFNPQNP